MRLFLIDQRSIACPTWPWWQLALNGSTAPSRVDTPCQTQEGRLWRIVAALRAYVQEQSEPGRLKFSSTVQNCIQTGRVLHAVNKRKNLYSVQPRSNEPFNQLSPKERERKNFPISHELLLVDLRSVSAHISCNQLTAEASQLILFTKRITRKSR